MGCDLNGCSRRVLIHRQAAHWLQHSISCSVAKTSHYILFQMKPQCDEVDLHWQKIICCLLQAYCEEQRLSVNASCFLLRSSNRIAQFVVAFIAFSYGFESECLVWKSARTSRIDRNQSVQHRPDEWASCALDMASWLNRSTSNMDTSHSAMRCLVVYWQAKVKVDKSEGMDLAGWKWGWRFQTPNEVMYCIKLVRPEVHERSLMNVG